MKVCLDPGHGGNDPGTVWGTDREKDLTMLFVSQLKALLRAELPRVVVITTRETDEYLTLADRCRKANSEGADVFISVHLNSSPHKDFKREPEPFGLEVWTYKGGLISEHLAEKILGEVRKSFSGYALRGVRVTEQLYVLKHTKCPAVLIELGFLNSLHDRVLLRDPEVRCRLAGAVVSALSTLSVQDHET
jgi:N-acetylmuramoyl-L-alanine amidase